MSDHRQLAFLYDSCWRATHGDGRVAGPLTKIPDMIERPSRLAQLEDVTFCASFAPF